MSGTGSGAGGKRIFTVNSGTLALSNLSLTQVYEDGRNNANDAFNGSGGAMFIVGGAAVTLGNCNVSNNSVVNRGGAISNYGTLTISNSTFSGNYSSRICGAIANYGTLAISNSTFSGNSSSGVPESGGAIYNTSTLTISNSTFSGNSASRGGAIYNAGGTATLSNCTLSGNNASESYGGAILNQSTLTVRNSTLCFNTAEFPGRRHLEQRHGEPWEQHRCQ